MNHVKYVPANEPNDEWPEKNDNRALVNMISFESALIHSNDEIHISDGPKK